MHQEVSFDPLTAWRTVPAVAVLDSFFESFGDSIATAVAEIAQS